ncbi:homeobox protein HAT3.1 [Quercus suber]|uniref:homeobox protein HAT3.1 n=1 Tax=Quercus suber TaxID=58331 RepID=UPI0032DFD470
MNVAEVGHMEVSSPAASQTGKSACPEQSESGQIHGSVFSEASELRHQLGSETIRNEQGEISFSEIVTEGSLTEPLGPPPEDVSKSGQAGKDSSPQQITSENLYDYNSASLSEPSYQKHQLGSELVHNKPAETSSAVSSCADKKKLQPSYENATNSSLAGPLPLDVSESIETGKILSTQQIILGQHDSDSGGLLGEPSEGKDQLASGLAQTRSVKTSPAVSSCFADKQLQSSFENVPKSSLTEYLGLPSEDVFKSSHAQTSLLPQQTTSEQVHEFGSANDLVEQKHQPGSELMQSEPLGTIVAGSSCVNEQMQSFSDSVAKNSVTDPVELLCENVSRDSQKGKSSCSQPSISEQTYEFGSGTGESSEQHQLDSEFVHNLPVETNTVVPTCVVIEQSEPHLEATKKCSLSEQTGPPPADSNKDLGTEPLGPPPDDVANNSTLEQLETPPKKTIKNPRRLGRRDKRTPNSLKKKYMLRSLVASDRVLRSRTPGKPKAPESSNNSAHVSTVEEKKKKIKKRRGKRVVADEFSRIKSRLRYLLNRISYEQSLIEAYSSEGWRGSSLEKLKPEKELQRATSEIFRRKLKIRDLFQHIDLLCAEGTLPDSLFDSDGQIDSEDIFCAKCGLKDLSANNDIILCDGACDRGFHQHCLEPPLLSEDIPPDDEGWLCPGCDCKDDCIDTLNEFQGTNLSITDSWEKVYPEAAAAAGHKQDHNFGLPSDDSDDNDYNPCEPDDENVEGDESSSDESEYASAAEDLEAPAEELEAPPKEEQYLGLPSDDSEDDEYDPDAPDLDEKVTKESSSSDFTSDSEDFAAVLDENRPLGGSGGKRSKTGGKKLLSTIDTEPGQDGSAPVSGRRQVERLDYKKLHDEEYGNISTDSSDDEDWNGIAAPKKRKRTTGEVAPMSPNGRTPNGKNNDDIKHNLKETNRTPKRNTRQKANVKDTNNSPMKSPNGSGKSGSSGKRTTSAYKKLGEAVTQRLYKSFKENQYPERATKESLAQELGLTFQKVSKWFENARWSFNHSSHMEAHMANSASKKDTPLPQKTKNA